MNSIDERMDMLEAMGYKFRPNPPREGEHGFGVYAHSVMSPEGEPLGSIPLLIGDTACHRLLDKFGCPQKPPENSMPDSSKDSPEEYAQKISDMATGKFRRVPIEFVPALPATKDPIYAQRMPNEAESIEVLRAATGRRDPFPHPAREQSEAARPASRPMTKPTCQSCPFWDTELGGSESGECRRYPPTFEYDFQPGFFPQTFASDWCGEHPDWPAYQNRHLAK